MKTLSDLIIVIIFLLLFSLFRVLAATTTPLFDLSESFIVLIIYLALFRKPIRALAVSFIPVFLFDAVNGGFPGWGIIETILIIMVINYLKSFISINAGIQTALFVVFCLFMLLSIKAVVTSIIWQRLDFLDVLIYILLNIFSASLMSALLFGLLMKLEGIDSSHEFDLRQT